MQIFAIIAAILFLVSLVGFVYYCVKGGNLIIGLFITATFWFMLGTIYGVWNGISANEIKTFADGWNLVVSNINLIYSEGPIKYGTTTTVIIFASWFGRVIVDTGIAKALIKRVVELSGDKQGITVIALAIVTALLFTSIFGPGSVMAIGAIILPILLTIGVNKKVAVGSFLMAVAAGMYVNSGYSIQFSQNPLFVGIWDQAIAGNFTMFAWIAFAVHVVIMLGFIVFNLYFSKDKIKAWAMTDDAAEEADVKGIAFLVPFIPILLSLLVVLINTIIKMTTPAGQVVTLATDFAAITSFVLGIVLGLLVTGNLKSMKKAVETSQKSLFNGISDVALLIGMLLVMNMFSTAAGKDIAGPILTAALGNSLDWIVANPIIIVSIFVVLAPLALFRGPFMIWGSGIALASVMATIIYGPAGTAVSPLLFVLFYVQPVAIVAQSCPTQSWGMWALSYAKYEPNTYIKTNILWAWAIAAINIFLAYFIFMG